MIGAEEILACRFVRPTDTLLKADTKDRRTLFVVVTQHYTPETIGRDKSSPYRKHSRSVITRRSG